MDRKRRSRPQESEEEVAEVSSRVRRVRAAQQEQEADPPEDEDDEDDDDDGGLDLTDSPDEPLEGESKMEASDRIEDKYRKRAKSPLKAIRAFCVVCMGCYPREVARCSARGCILYPFRFGRNPYQKRG